MLELHDVLNVSDFFPSLTILSVCLSSLEFPPSLKIAATAPAITSMFSVAQRGKAKCKSVEPSGSVPPFEGTFLERSFNAFHMPWARF